MRREPERLSQETFDLLVIGGGVTGAFTAWDATLRGLRVALVEREDFGAATSANSLRIVHGGLRYLQQANWERVRASAAEQAIFLRIAPGLVRPLPCLAGTHGLGLRSRLAFRAAFGLYRRLAHLDGVLPPPRLLSSTACRELAPGFEDARLTGGALWYDAQVHDSERLILSLLSGTANRGGVVANYTEADRLLERGGRTTGALVRDRLSGARYQIRARSVVNATGPWLRTLAEPGADLPRHLALAVNLVIRRPAPPVAVALPVRTSADDPAGASRNFFLVPWRGLTVVGTAYRRIAGPWQGTPDADLLDGFLRDITRACPDLQLTRDDVIAVQSGMLPVRAASGSAVPRLADRSRVIPHRTGGVFTVESVKYTTARRLAQRAVDRVLDGLDRRLLPCRTHAEPLPLGRRTVTDLPAMVRRAVHEEMAIHLPDLIFRRLGWGPEGPPSRPLFQQAAETMRQALNWSAAACDEEMAAVERVWRTVARARAA